MSNRVWVCVGCILLLMFLSAAQIANSQDPVKLAPQHYTILFENEGVRVIEVHLQPGEKSPLHSHPPGFAYALTTFKAKTIHEDGTAVVGEYKAGTFAPTKPISHMEENIGDTEARVLLIEFKRR